MAFPGNSETELLLSLQRAVVEESGWTGFLAELAAMTSASFAALIVETRGSSGSVHIVNAMPNGQPVPNSSDALGTILSDRLRPERIYSASELKDLDSGDEIALALDRLDARALRAMRVVVSDALAITVGIFGSVEFGAADGAILRRLFPYLKASTQAAAMVGRERFRASVSAGVARKTGLGWFLLDRAGFIVEAAFDRQDRLPGLRILAGQQGERMAFADRSAESALADILDRCASATAERSSAIRISDLPLVHLHISPFSSSDFALRGSPVAIATLHGQSQMKPDGADMLVDLFGLLPSEARLAKALASGESLAEAAEQMGLTIETVRNYSKKIFAKTGTRGQADLVRSILAIGLAELEDPLRHL
ncbi:helix-turn-helix transcriptional regulator [Parasphingorhabdus sp.]|uniref:helix-turn-helix transcriptional regulator n=1 Tax=Parasphingorhabdus sp. TaxID=2709688 RepID=UPI003A95A113